MYFEQSNIQEVCERLHFTFKEDESKLKSTQESIEKRVRKILIGQGNSDVDSASPGWSRNIVKVYLLLVSIPKSILYQMFTLPLHGGQRRPRKWEEGEKVRSTSQSGIVTCVVTQGSNRERSRGGANTPQVSETLYCFGFRVGRQKK